MRLVEVTEFIDELATRISGAPTDTLLQELRACLREFYVWSNAWTTLSGPLDMQAGQVEFDFNRVTGGDVLSTIAVYINGHKTSFTGTEKPGIVNILGSYAREKPDAITALVSLKPKDYNYIPEETVTYDFDTILDGATGRLFAMPDRPWSNAPRAEYYLRRFKQGETRARERTRKRFTVSSTRIPYPPW